MLLLKFSHTVPSFGMFTKSFRITIYLRVGVVAAYIFYALAQSVTPAPQVEIIRSVIADPQWFATAFAIKSTYGQYILPDALIGHAYM